MTDPDGAHRQAEQPEDLQRPRRIAQQELDGHQIEHHANRAPEAVLRSPVHAGAMVDRQLRDPHAFLAGERGQEAMELAVQPQRLDDLRAKDLERAAVVVEPHAGRPRDQPVGDHRRQPASEEAVLPVLAPAADDVEALLDARDQRRRGPSDRSAGRRRTSRSAARARARSRRRTPPSGRSCAAAG